MLLPLALAAVFASSAEAKQGGVVTMNGRVGSLQTGKSTAAQVRAKVGRPTSSRKVQTGARPTKFLALTYGCGGGKSTGFYFDAKGRLANFVTTCQSWQTPAGTRVGDDSETAADAEDREPSAQGCGDGTVIAKRGKATLYVTFATDDEVTALAVEGTNSVLDC